MVAEAEMFLVYTDEYRDGVTSLRFAEVAYGRYLPSGNDRHRTPNLAPQRCNMFENRCSVLSLEVLENEDEWHFKGLVLLKELERTGVCGKLCEAQNVCPAKKKRF